jgi:cellulose synthase/poly-beta-1,6-N-acetylglucosamine synthase-like glycosyltransferase
MWVIEIILLVYFVYVVGYTFIFSFAAHYYKANVRKSEVYSKFCVLIPSYKEDNVILDVARRALKQNYPSEKYDVVVIADSLKPETVSKLRELPVIVREVVFESSTKVKSLNAALCSLSDDYNYAVILDADNIMDIDFLKHMNDAGTSGYKAIQGQRKPKNQDTTLSFLDGVSEAINNHIYRQGSVALGLSASINGSGIAFDYHALKKKLADMNSVGGFDRELELKLLLDGISVHYYPLAIVLDEKTSKSEVFQNQRKRWISSQYFYLRKYFKSGMTKLFEGDYTFFNSAVLRNIQLPRLVNIGLLTILTIAFAVIQSYLFFGYWPWLILFILNTAAILIAIPREMYSGQLLGSLFALPGIFFRMFLLLFKLKGANKKFIHTPHGVTSNSETTR